MKLFLVTTAQGVRFKVVSKEGAVTLFDPTLNIAMNLMTGKLICLDAMKGSVLQHILGSVCEVIYLNSSLLVPLGGTVVISPTLSPQHVADLYSLDGQTVTPLKMEDLFRELDKRVEAVKMSVESRSGEIPITEEYPLGTFSDDAINPKRWL